MVPMVWLVILVNQVWKDPVGHLVVKDTLERKEHMGKKEKTLDYQDNVVVSRYLQLITTLAY